MFSVACLYLGDMKWQDKDRIMQEFLSFSVLFLIVWYTCTKFSGDFRYGAEGKMKIGREELEDLKEGLEKLTHFIRVMEGVKLPDFIGILMR